MRYQQPSLKSVLEKIQQNMPEQLIVLPMYPQYASSTTGSTFEKVMQLIKSWEVIPEVKFINQFFDHKDYIECIAQNAEKHDLKRFDHFLFSYHGLPIRQINKIHPNKNCNNCSCDQSFDKDSDYYCYKATCYETSRLLAKRLHIAEENYTVGFQSRLDKNWLEPFSDKVIEEQAKKGAKNIMVFSPAFVADCLETTIEIGEEYQELFQENGGKELILVESLNDHDLWIKCLKSLIQE
jgi:ferrochelatase